MTSIYIIDDEQQTAEMFGEFAKRSGFAVETYTSAIKFFERDPECLGDCIIVLDLKMPEMDGVEVIRLLAEKGTKASLILVSGYDTSVLNSAEKLAKAHALHVLASITKPVQIKVFQNILDQYAAIIEHHHDENVEHELLPTHTELQDAINKEQLILHFQPQIDIQSGSLAGVEALVRWQHPDHGLIYPNLFIPLAEKHNLMGELTSLVIKFAIEQESRWKKESLMVPISINVSSENISSLTLPEQLSSLLTDNQIDPTMLVLEITESALMGELVTSLDILTRLRMKGFDLSIDDFGTGYSSLSQLHRVPFTELKIDQSFVMHMNKDEEARAIVQTCIMLGHELNMNVVAEGVETEETLNMLKNMGCDTAQGYYIARPMPAENLLAWVHNRY